MKRLIAVLFTALTIFLFGQDEILNMNVELPEAGIPAGTGTDISIILDIKETWHINSAKVLDDYSIPTEVSLSGRKNFELKNIHYPKGKITSLSWGGNMSLYEGIVKIPAVLYTDKNLSPGLYELEFDVSYQACNDITCMPPETKHQTFKVRILSPGTANEVSDINPNGQMNESGKAASFDKINRNTDLTGEEGTESLLMDKQMESDGASGKENPFQGRNIIVVLLIVFVMGLALNLTPCVYPLIPITMGYFLAQKETKSPVLLAVMYVIGLAITYSIIGTLAAFGGSMMGSLLAHPATLIFFALLMLALSLSMFGLYEFRLPKALTQVGGGSRSGAVGALIMGLTMGIVAAPCVGPFVVSLLGFVAQKGSIFIGFITFFILALGLGVPYLFLGIFSNKINNLPRSGEWLNGIRIFFGLALVGMSIYFILPLIRGAIAGFILPVYMIAAAVYYGVIDRSGLTVPWFSRLKVVLAMIVLAAGIIMMPSFSQTAEELTWEAYSTSALETSISEKKPVIVDFYAEWCNPCKELEHITFADPEVQEILKDFTRLKVDLTVVNDKTNALKDQFDIPGVPTILFYDKTGQERKDLRLNGFENSRHFIRRLEKLLNE